MSQTRLVAWAGALAGVSLITYSVYFDRWRRSQPDYKKKIRESMFFKVLRV